MFHSPIGPDTFRHRLSETSPCSSGLQRFQPGQMIFVHGERQQVAHVVEAGLVALSRRHEDGRRHIIFLAGPGDVLGAPFSDTAPADAEVLVPTEVRLHQSRLIESDTALAARLTAQLQQQFERTLKHVFAMGQREARQRLGWFLASFAGGERQLTLPMSRQDMADYLGLTIETISREFTRLKRQGVIGYERHGSITILKPDRLLSASGS